MLFRITRQPSDASRKPSLDHMFGGGFTTVPHKPPKASAERPGCASSDSGMRSFVVGKHVCVFYSARRARRVRWPDFHTLCGPAPPEVKEQEDLSLRQQDQRADPLDSRRSRQLRFPANDSTPTEQESREGGFHFRGESANANNGRDFTGIRR